jgi:hypothetical protein
MLASSIDYAKWNDMYTTYMSLKVIIDRDRSFFHHASEVIKHITNKNYSALLEPACSDASNAM